MYAIRPFPPDSLVASNLPFPKRGIGCLISGMRRLIFTLALFAGATFAAPVSADETWNSPSGLIIWERDIGNTSVFTFTTPVGTGVVTTRIFINGLPATMNGGRGVYTGYWVDDSGRRLCEADLVDLSGARASAWGRFHIAFANRQFPSDWRGVWGQCFDEPTYQLDAVSTANAAGAKADRKPDLEFDPTRD